MVKPEKRGLGRGLSALISPGAVAIAAGGGGAVAHSREVVVDLPVPTLAPSSVEPEHPEGAIRHIPLEKIINNPSQPRQQFREEELDELAESIKKLGVLQPVLLRRIGPLFEIVAGERRWRAAKRAGLVEVPALVKELDDRDALQIAIVENVQREQLNPLEEAMAYDRLMKEFGYTQEQLSDVVGKGRATIANSLRLLRLAPEVLSLLSEEKLSAGHAKALLGIRDQAGQVSLARKVLSEGLSVRALESLVQRVVVLDSGRAPKKEKFLPPLKDPEPYPEVLDRLRESLGTRVALHHSVTGKGKIEIQYYSEQELDRIVDIISRRP